MGGKILIVDDDQDVAELLQVVLIRAGHTTLTASTGEEALTKAQESTPDLIILDLLLPDANGFTVCEQLRRHRATASVPIIIVTGLPGELPRFAGVEAGADVYLRKPFEIQTIVSRVDALLHQSRRVTLSFLATG